MIQIPMNIKEAVDCNTIDILNHSRKSQNISGPAPDSTAKKITQSQEIHPQQIPHLVNPIQKGQKVSIASASSLHAVKACFGWNIKDPRCDVDVSAFLLNADGKVLGDEWFVFYGQTKSPDNSTRFSIERNIDRESVTIDFDRLHPNIKKIVFVLTINEAFENKLHFEMIKDAYIRILNQDAQSESVSFQITDYYSNVISMMIGEIYQHNGSWKFGAVGNGVARDLAGLCTLYGVQITD